MTKKVEKKSSEKFKICIVEDDKMLGKYLLASFQKEEGIDVQLAQNGNDGIELIKEMKPDLVLLDVMMPIKNGFEVLEEVRQEKSLDKAKIIMLSNLSSKSDMDQAKKLKAYDFWTKVDMNTTEIVEKVKKILSK